MERKIDIKDIHQTFWRCRDFELSNLWQRSVFLTAFLVLCLTAYGAVLMKMLDSNFKDFYLIFALNIAEYVLSILGLIFSILWIKMAKGSKAWYEVYESAIGALERNKNYTTEQARKIGGFSYAKLSKYGGVDIDNRLFSMDAGEYSVSKINIAIGQVFLVFWLAINVIHVVIIYRIFNKFNLGNLDVIALVLGFLVLGLILWLFGNSKSLRSGSLGGFKKSNRIILKKK